MADPLHLAICVPSLGTVLTETALSISGMGILSAFHGIKQSVLMQQSASVSACRNLLVQSALESGADWTLWVDGDMAFNPELALRLLSHEKEIVGATYPRRVPPYITNGRFKGEFTGLVEAEFMPFGAMLVKTEVFTKIRYPWFYESYEFDGSGPEQVLRALSCALNVPIPPAFQVEIQDSLCRHFGQEEYPTAHRGEDANFCREAQRAGYTVWCDADLSREMIHIGKQCVSIGAALPGLASEKTEL